MFRWNFVLPILSIFILGLCIGSFLNVVIFRLNENKNFIKGRSKCPKCKHILSWHDNIPLLSFLVLKGKCRYCKNKISWQYPLVELITALLFVTAFMAWEGNYLLLFSYFIFTAFLIIIFVYDLRWYLILDKITLPAIIAALAINLWLSFMTHDEWGAIIYTFQNLLLAGVVVSGFFLAQFLISKGRWIGGGDIRLGFLMGIMLGWPYAVAALFLSYIIGSITGLFLIAIGKKKISSKVPFGTFLALGTYIIMLYGREIVEWYLEFIR